MSKTKEAWGFHLGDPYMVDRSAVEKLLGRPPRRQWVRPKKTRLALFSYLFLQALLLAVIFLTRPADNSPLSVIVPASALALWSGHRLRRELRGKPNHLSHGELCWVPQPPATGNFCYDRATGEIAQLRLLHPWWARLKRLPPEMTALYLGSIHTTLEHHHGTIMKLILEPDDARRFAEDQGLLYWEALAEDPERPISLRQEALDTLLSQAAQTTIKALMEAILKDDDAPELHPTAIHWLNEHRHLSQRDALARLRSEHGPTVVAALQALAQIGDTSALPSLTAYATDTRHEVSNAAKATLQTLQERARAQGAAAGLSLGEAGSEGELSLAQPGEAGQLSPPAQDDGKKPDD